MMATGFEIPREGRPRLSLARRARPPARSRRRPVPQGARRARSTSAAASSTPPPTSPTASACGPASPRAMVDYPIGDLDRRARPRDGRHAVLQALRARRRPRPEHRDRLQRPRPRRPRPGRLLQPRQRGRRAAQARRLRLGRDLRRRRPLVSQRRHLRRAVGDDVRADHRRHAGGAKAHGAVVSFDLNYREKLWTRGRRRGPRAQQMLARIVEHVDVLVGNEEDLQKGLGIAGPEVAATSKLDPSVFFGMIDRVVEQLSRRSRSSRRRCARCTRPTATRWGAVAWIDGQTLRRRRRCELDVHDRVGGGDGFASGLLLRPAHRRVAGAKPCGSAGRTARCSRRSPATRRWRRSSRCGRSPRAARRGSSDDSRRLHARGPPRRLRRAAAAAQAPTSGRSLDLDAAEALARHIAAGGITPVPLRRQRVPLSRHARRIRGAARLARRRSRPTAGRSPASARRSAARSIRRALLRRHRFPARHDAALRRSRATRRGLEAGLREIADAAGMPLILYLKSEDGFGADRDAGPRRGRAASSTTASRRDQIRRRPRRSRAAIRISTGCSGASTAAASISGMGERPAIVHLRDFGLGGLTTGSGLHRAAPLPGAVRRPAAPATGRRREASARRRSCRSRTCATPGVPRACCITRPSWPASRRPVRSRRIVSALDARRSSQRARARCARRAAAGAERVSAPRRRPTDLRSHRWFGKDDLRSFGHRSRAKQAGLQRRGHRRQAGHRHPQHLERRQPLPHAFPDARRGREARRLAGGRLPDGDPGPHARRDVHEADARCSIATCWRWRPRKRCAPIPADGVVLLGGCDKTVPGAAHGRDEREPARDLRARRADAARQLARPDPRLRHRRRGSTGPRSAPARSTSAPGARWRTASRARSAPA